MGGRVHTQVLLFLGHAFGPVEPLLFISVVRVHRPLSSSFGALYL